MVLLRVEPRRKVQRPVEAGAALITADRPRRPTTIISRKAAHAPSLLAAQAKQFTSARPWCSNAGRAIRLPVIRRPRETIPRRVIRRREITQLRVTRLRVALPLRPSTVVAAAAAAPPVSMAVAEAVETGVAVEAVVVAVTAVAAAEATVKA